MTSPAEIETINQMIRTALLSDNDGEALNSIRAASRKITKHSLDAHTAGLNASTTNTRPSSRYKSYADDSEWKLKHEIGKLRDRLKAEETHVKAYREAWWAEHQTSKRLLEFTTSLLGWSVYSDHLYADQSMEGGVKRRWLKSGDVIMALSKLRREVDDLREVETELADLRAKLKALAGDQP